MGWMKPALSHPTITVSDPNIQMHPLNPPFVRRIYCCIEITNTRCKKGQPFGWPFQSLFATLAKFPSGKATDNNVLTKRSDIIQKQVFDRNIIITDIGLSQKASFI